MATKYIKCTFETGIVLLATSNSEGRSTVLDFVPGSKFVGVAAKLINEGRLGKLNFKMLHDGSIRFGEATLYKDNKMTYKVPLSYFKPKVSTSNDPGSYRLYHHHLATSDDHTTYQLQQLRRGYMIPGEKVYYEPSYNYRQKSTKKAGRDKNEKEMYGYDAANRTQEWIFTISADDDTVLNEIVEAFTRGSHSVGKSKRVEYGKVSFEELEGFNESIESLQENTSELTLLYVKSRLALFDLDTGASTFEPTIKNLGLNSGVIDWSNTQIRTSSFTPYNVAQKSYTSERMVIEKGSVIALLNVSRDDLEVFNMPIGAHTNEGYGEILVNPAFLAAEHPTFDLDMEIKTIEPESLSEYEPTDPFMDYLVAKKRKVEAENELMQTVNDFINEENNISFAKNMKSQWGKIRSLALSSTVDNVEKRVEHYMSHGIEKNQWKGKKEKIFAYISKKEIEDIPEFFAQLSQQMQLLNKSHRVQGGTNEV